MVGGGPRSRRIRVFDPYRSLTETWRAISTRTTVPDPELVQVIAELDSGIATMARALRGFTADGLSDQADEDEAGTSVDHNYESELDDDDE